MREGFLNVAFFNEIAADTPDASDPFTVGHEIGHVVLDDGGHEGVATNLMRGGLTSLQEGNGASKRLTETQHDRARTASENSPAILKKM